MGYSVGQVAALARVTVRTLHHYDEIGLLSPSERTAAGYRQYNSDDLERLQHILFYRELGFPLDEIAGILRDRSTGTASHLRRQQRLLRERIGRLQAMAAAVETALEADTMSIPLTRRTGSQFLAASSRKTIRRKRASDGAALKNSPHHSARVPPTRKRIGCESRPLPPDIRTVWSPS